MSAGDDEDQARGAYVSRLELRGSDLGLEIRETVMTSVARGVRASGGMTRMKVLFLDPHVWRVASLLLALVLVACQENDGGGGGGVDPGY